MVIASKKSRITFFGFSAIGKPLQVSIQELQCLSSDWYGNFRGNLRFKNTSNHKWFGDGLLIICFSENLAGEGTLYFADFIIVIIVKIILKFDDVWHLYSNINDVGNFYDIFR